MTHIITRDQESPPLTFGARRVHYSYSVALPQMHLTFVSVLEGLALGELVADIPLPKPSNIGPTLIAQHAYLPYIVSALLILLIWKQFAHNSTFSVWPPSTSQLGLSLLVAVSQVLAFRVIGDFGQWLIGIGATGVVGGIIRLNNMRLQAPGDWESEMLDGLVRRTNRRDGSLYIILGGLVMLVGAGVLRLEATGAANAQSTSALLSVMEWIGPLVLLGALAFIERLDNHLRKAIIEHAIHESDLEMTPVGRVRYRAGAMHHSGLPSAGSAGMNEVHRVVYETDGRADSG